MNNALAARDIGATRANVHLTFTATLDQGFDYTAHNTQAGGFFIFLPLAGAGQGNYSPTDLHVYSHYQEALNMTVDITFEPLPNRV